MEHSHVEALLTDVEEQEIVQAILQAEDKTSGEIRVHIEKHAPGNPYDRARRIFRILKMDNTRESNGVLFYLAVADRKFAIYGDKGINAVVPEGFWDSTRDLLTEHFKRGEFKQGLVAGILNAGKELKKHFPWNPSDDNELSDEISRA